jgi:subtilisin family serine protease
MRRFVVMFAVAALAASLAAPAVAGNGLTLAGGITLDSTYSVAKSLSGRIAQSDAKLLARTDSKVIPVIVKFDLDSVAAYQGGVPGFAATSPAKTGKSLKQNKRAVTAYRQYLAGATSKLTKSITSKVAGAKIGTVFTEAYGGVAVSLPANKAKNLLSIPGVVAVQNDSLEQPLTDATPAFLGADQVWPSIGGSIHAGEGVKVGIIDTGIWPEHPSFADLGLSSPGGSYGCQFGDGSDVAHLGDPFHCNNKLIGAYAKTDTYMANVGAGADQFCNNATHQCSARDSEGHGTHTASTAAGDPVDDVMLLGVNRGHISGMAPGAHVIMYRVCLELGCFSSDSVSAVNQAITDGVDVINFSISGGRNPYSDAVELAFLDAYAAGISVNASAGNSGPGAGTADHGGPWVTTVGASTSNRHFLSTLHLTADGGASLDIQGVTITAGVGATDVVLASAAPYSDAICNHVATAGTFTGKIVVCARGTNARVDKGYNVLQGGAAGMILYNQNAATTDVETDNHWLPAIHVQYESNAIATFVSDHTNVLATWASGVASPVPGDVMASFSSRGPGSIFLKPDVTAPGVQILAGHTPEHPGITNGPLGEYYQAIAGTSMSSPHAAGVAALVKAAHPSWTPGQIKSSLMTSSLQSVLKENGTTAADPFDRGAGSIRANRAVKPTVTFDVDPADYYASAADSLNRVNLNLPSINVPTMAGTLTTWRTVTNVSGTAQLLKATTTAPGGASITVSPANIAVPAGGTATFSVTINGTALANGQYFGQVKLTPAKAGGYLPAVVPVAFFKQPAQVTLSHSCADAEIDRNTSTSCEVTVTNLSTSAANVDLSVQGPTNGKLAVQNVSAPGVPSGNGFTWSGTLAGAQAPTIDSITPTIGPAEGYLPLSAFGIAPISAGDDTITNFNVPTYYYGGEAYTRIGVVSNGYVVVGGGTNSDIVYFPQTFPNPAVPNNVVALLWSDLNPAGGGGAGGIRIATLTDGFTTWLVVDYAGIKNFGNATTHSMELWIRLEGGAAGSGAASEEWTMTYGAANTASPDPDSGGNSGAENRVGNSGVNLSAPANNTEWAINTSPPAPGGSQTITYDAFGRNKGTFTILASMTSDITSGATTKPVSITVK